MLRSDPVGDNGERGEVIEIHPDYLGFIRRRIAEKLEIPPEDLEASGDDLPASYRAIEDKAGVPRSTLHKFFKEGRPTSTAARKLCEWLGIPPPNVAISTTDELDLLYAYRHLKAPHERESFAALIDRGRLEREKLKADERVRRNLPRRRSDPPDKH